MIKNVLISKVYKFWKIKVRHLQAEDGIGEIVNFLTFYFNNKRFLMLSRGQKKWYDLKGNIYTFTKKGNRIYLYKLAISFYKGE